MNKLTGGAINIVTRKPSDGVGNQSSVRIGSNRRADARLYQEFPLIEMDGGQYRIYMDSRKVSEAGASRGIVGGFGLGLRARGRVQVRNVRVRVRR